LETQNKIKIISTRYKRTISFRNVLTNPSYLDKREKKCKYLRSLIITQFNLKRLERYLFL